MADDPSPSISPGSRAPPSRPLRWAGIVIAAALLAAAVIVVVRQHDAIGHALDAMRQPAASQLGLLLGSVLANLLLTGLLFTVLISRYGKVGRVEMQALIAAATLLNFLPLRPGLFGRIAYHRTFNAIPAAASVRTVVQAMILSVVAAGYLATALVVSSQLGAPLWAAVALPIPLLAAGTLRPGARIWVAAGLLRYLEVMVWAVRYHAAFALIGAPIAAESALALACLGMITMLVPFFGNGLGLREWAIGLATPILVGGDAIIALGITADLLNRAAEVLVVLVLGLTGMGYLMKRQRS